jgi:hypothetical protein
LIEPKEAILVLCKWQEEQTPLRVVVESAALHVNSEAVIIGATTRRFALRLAGEGNFFELDFGFCRFDFGHDPAVPDRTTVVCVNPDRRISFSELVE